MRHLFEAICANESGTEFAVSCSYLEIYKEARAAALWCACSLPTERASCAQVVRDLLQPAAPDCKTMGGLQIREDVRGGKGVFVEGLTQVFVMGEADVLECLTWCVRTDTAPSVPLPMRALPSTMRPAPHARTDF